MIQVVSSPVALPPVQQHGVVPPATNADGDLSYRRHQRAVWKIRGLLVVLMFLVVYLFPALLFESRSVLNFNASPITIKRGEVGPSSNNTTPTAAPGPLKNDGDHHQEKNTTSTSTLQVLGTISSSSSCRRQCRSRKNIIWLSRPTAAGLNDRQTVFQYFAAWAGYLCATLYVSPPTSMLHPKHNGGKRVSANLSWSDFKVTAFLDGNATALEIYYPKSKTFPPNRIDLGSNTTSWWKLQLRKGGKTERFVSQVTELINFVDSQQQQDESAPTAFLWEILVVPWNSFGIRNSSRFTGARPSELPSPTGPCTYVVDSIGETTRSLVDQIFDSIRQAHPTISGGIVHFHIRRDDAIQDCDTSLRRMHNYMMCSLGGETTSAISSMFGNMTMLFSSDERDPCYRQAIQQIVERGLGYGFVDLDAIIQTVLNTHIAKNGDDARLDNNFYLYHLENLVSSDPRMNLRLEQRRSYSCKDCETDLGSVENRNQALGFNYDKAAALDLDLNLTLEEYRDCTKIKN